MTPSGIKTATEKAKTVTRVPKQRVLPKVWLSDLSYILPLMSSPPLSQGSVPRAMQVLQGRLLYRRGVMSIFPRKQRTWSTERRLRLVRQGELQIWS